MSSTPPSTLAIVFSTGILCLVTGFFLGQGSSLGLFTSSARTSKSKSKSKPKAKAKAKAKAKSWPNSYDVTVHPDSSDEELMAHLRGLGKAKNSTVADDNSENDDDDEDDGSSSSADEESEGDMGTGELKTFKDYQEDFKLVLVVRTDIGMTKGKIAAQCSHATLQNYKAILRSPASSLLSRWEAGGQAKIAVQAQGADQELQLASLAQAAQREGLCALVVRDQGRTQIASGTRTVLGVGPGPIAVVNRVTGGLKLL